ncbi:MAG: TldD/PmbA family protein [bacterium]|nr:TldD/PmbA family protein [bacterium]
MLEKLSQILSKTDNQFADIRYEDMHKVDITYNGRLLSGISSNFSNGFFARVFHNGSMASGAFSRFRDGDYMLKKMSNSARLISGIFRKKAGLKKAVPVQDVVRLSLDINPRKISLKEKQDLLKYYNDIILGHHQIQTTRLTYSEIYRKKYYVTNEGTSIEQEIITTSITGGIWAKKGDLIQNIRVAIGGSTGFEPLLDRDQVFKDKTMLCIRLLDADPVKAGNHKVLLDNQISGVFIHEAVGHLSETDFIENTPMQKKMTLNKKIGSDALNIIDDATIKNSLSYYKYDDEGVRSARNQIMKNGLLVGRLHSRQTAHNYGETLTGNCVAEDFSHPPIIRMSNIYVEPGKHTFNELLNSIDNGIYICGGKGGQTLGDLFSFGAQYGYEIKNGNIGKMLRDINMSGNVFHTLKNVKMIGNDLKFSEAGACNKGQINIKSCYGAPHMIIDNVTIGGD